MDEEASNMKICITAIASSDNRFAFKPVINKYSVSHVLVVYSLYRLINSVCSVTNWWCQSVFLDMCSTMGVSISYFNFSWKFQIIEIIRGSRFLGRLKRRALRLLSWSFSQAKVIKFLGSIFSFFRSKIIRKIQNFIY